MRSAALAVCLRKRQMLDYLRKQPAMAGAAAFAAIVPDLVIETGIGHAGVITC